VAGFSTWVSRWPRSPPLELPLEEAETVAACLRYVEFLDREIAAVEALVAKAGAALAAAQARRLSGCLPPVSGCAKPARAEQTSQPALPVARPSSSYNAELWLPVQTAPRPWAPHASCACRWTPRIGGKHPQTAATGRRRIFQQRLSGHSKKC